LTLTKVYCNDQSTIALLKDNQFHECTKQIDLHHFIQETIEKQLSLPYCLTDEMTVDIFIKALLQPKLQYFVAQLGLCYT
jgi:hypothetical protein